MIQKKYNPITSGCSGKFGDVVFRQRGNRLVIAKLSGKPHKKGTRAQKKQRNRFTEANDYATTVQYDKKLTSLYKKRANANVNVRNLAVGDYLKAPVINDIDISQYKGRPGNEIEINAVDDFMVKAVTVSIYNSNNELLETGAAVVSPVTYKGRKTFTQTAVYTTTIAHTGAVRIVVNAADLAGNVSTEEVYVQREVLTPTAGIASGKHDDASATMLTPATNIASGTCDAAQITMLIPASVKHDDASAAMLTPATNIASGQRMYRSASMPAVHNVPDGMEQDRMQKNRTAASTERPLFFGDVNKDGRESLPDLPV